MTLSLCFLVVWRGGAPERAGAGILLIGFVADQLWQLAVGPVQFRRFDGFAFATDFAQLIGFGWVALRANRVWPMVCTALQLMSVIGHLSVAVLQGGMQRAYWAMVEPPLALCIVTLAVGMVLHLLRVRRIGPYPDWRPG